MNELHIDISRLRGVGMHPDTQRLGHWVLLGLLAVVERENEQSIRHLALSDRGEVEDQVLQPPAVQDKGAKPGLPRGGVGVLRADEESALDTRLVPGLRGDVERVYDGVGGNGEDGGDGGDVATEDANVELGVGAVREVRRGRVAILHVMRGIGLVVGGGDDAGAAGVPGVTVMVILARAPGR